MQLQRILGALALLLTLSRPLPLAAEAGAPVVQNQGTETLTLVAGGCGPNAWRGPWGGCRDTPYNGPLPGGAWQGPPRNNQYFGNGCPAGYWKGPWGHCRNTPYHGRLPDGQWK